MFLAAVLLGVCVLRTWLVISDAWTPEEGGDLPEGLLEGRLAFDLLNGTWRGWAPYLYVTEGHLGNDLIVTAQVLGPFAVFGESLLVLSLVPTLNYCLIIAVAFILCSRHFSATSAYVAALFLVCAPWEVQGWDLYPYAIHVTSGLYMLGAFVLFLSMLEARSEGARRGRGFALGLLCALGLFHSQVFSLSLFVLAVVWARTQPRVWRRREFQLAALGFALGMAPQLALAGRHHLGFVARLLSGGYGFSHANREVSVLTTLHNFEILFWPLRWLTPWGAVVLGLTLTAAIPRLAPLEGKPGRPARELLLGTLALGLVGSLAGKISNLYYLFPLFALANVVMAVGVASLLERFGTSRARKVGIALVLVALPCLLSLRGLAGQVKTDRVGERFATAQARRGHAFWWPEPYWPFAGHKTPTTEAVEAYAVAHAFTETAPREGVPRKRIYINASDRAGYHPLDSPEAWMLYGIDVPFEGLEKLAHELSASAPPEARQPAFDGLAVFFVNETLFKDLVAAFQTGRIEKAIPPEHQAVFYSELGRRLRDRYSEDRPGLDRVVAGFSSTQREWIEAGVAKSRWVRPERMNAPVGQ